MEFRVDGDEEEWLEPTLGTGYIRSTRRTRLPVDIAAHRIIVSKVAAWNIADTSFDGVAPEPTQDRFVFVKRTKQRTHRGSPDPEGTASYDIPRSLLTVAATPLVLDSPNNTPSLTVPDDRCFIQATTHAQLDDTEWTLTFAK